MGVKARLKRLIRPRGFEVVSNPTFEVATILPTRSDDGSAGYDFYSKINVKISPNARYMFATDVKAYMKKNEVLYVHVRSSLGINKGMKLANGTGVIDSTYYNNDKNEGNIIICLENTSKQPVHIKAGDRIAQGVFHKYLTVGDKPTGVRKGGIGSTGK